MTKRGRPKIYGPEMRTKVCDMLASGRSLRSICAEKDMPGMTIVFGWLANEPDFAQQYARAREAQADTMLEEILQIADDGQNDTYLDDQGNPRTNHDVVQRSRLRVDARKWAMSKMAPKKYGEKLDIEHSGGVTVEIRRYGPDQPAE